MQIKLKTDHAHEIAKAMQSAARKLAKQQKEFFFAAGAAQPFFAAEAPKTVLPIEVDDKKTGQLLLEPLVPATTVAADKEVTADEPPQKRAPASGKRRPRAMLLSLCLLEPLTIGHTADPM